MSDAAGKVMLKARKRGPKPQLVTIPKTEPPTRWEGRIKGESGSARSADFGVVAVIGFAAGVMEGQGRSPEFPYRGPDSVRAFLVTGSRHGGSVAFDIIFHCDDYFRTRPFSFVGEMDGDERYITGRWTYRCGDACDCGGSAGAFELRRVEG